jgi:hypothetical protein
LAEQLLLVQGAVTILTPPAIDQNSIALPIAARESDGGVKTIACGSNTLLLVLHFADPLERQRCAHPDTIWLHHAYLDIATGLTASQKRCVGDY